jgi:putative ABC transport system substrate-binding protein
VSRPWTRTAASLGAFVIAALLPGSIAAGQSDQGFDIVMVTFRGCEEACRGFQDYLAGTDLDVDVEVRDIDRDRDLLPGLIEQIQAEQPDLVVTWGTTVTVTMLGTIDDDEGALQGIPAVFMIVADPLGARVVESAESSGRPWITGTFNRVPEETQMRVIGDYRPFTRVGLVYNDSELNAVLKADELKRVANEMGFTIVERVIENDADGDPIVDDIPRAVADIAEEGVDFLYLGSSSFLLENADLFTLAALDHELPVATAYEAMVRDSHALISVASSYYNVGQLAGFQAEQILEGAQPGDLDIAGLDRFTVLVNIDTAHRLQFYPPMLMLRYAEIVGVEG